MGTVCMERVLLRQDPKLDLFFPLHTKGTAMDAMILEGPKCSTSGATFCAIVFLLPRHVHGLLRSGEIALRHVCTDCYQLHTSSFNID
jgi:hypothetical protein